jgi:hypothetical protein
MLRKALLLFSILAATASTGQEALGRQAVVPVAKPAVNDMTSEEALVRTAYAKFAYATEQEVIYQLALEPSSTPTPKSGSSPTGDQRLASASVTFKLSDFVVGDLRDIVNRKAVDLITPPNGEMLAATPHTSSLSEGGVSTIVESIQPRWKPASVTSPEVLDATLGALHEMEWHTQAPTTTWQRYASYSVTVTFQGKSRGPYKALFIFGHDAKGNAEVMPEDANTDSMALATVLTVHLFPRPLAESRLRTYPVVANWLSARQRSGATCSRGQGDVCCDLVELQCGPGSDDVADGLLKPLPLGVPEQK